MLLVTWDTLWYYVFWLYRWCNFFAIMAIVLVWFSFMHFPVLYWFNLFMEVFFFSQVVFILAAHIIERIVFKPLERDGINWQAVGFRVNPKWSILVPELIEWVVLHTWEFVLKAVTLTDNNNLIVSSVMELPNFDVSVHALLSSWIFKIHIH